MFLRALHIKIDNEFIREINFRKGLNLIIDETHTDRLQESGNNVGKTTVLRLIDYCLGGKGQNIYKDPEFKEKSNTHIEAFLKNKNVTITLILKEDLESETSSEIVIRRNFLLRKNKIQEINGESYSDHDFHQKLKELVFNTKIEKPTFRQIIAKNIRDEKNRLTNTLKVLHVNTTYEEYEALYFFWFGIEIETGARRQRLCESKRTEEKIVQRLKKENTVSEIEQSLAVIERDIEELNALKRNFKLNDKFEEDISLLNNTKSQLNRVTTEIGRLEIRKNLILESKSDLEKELAQVDTRQLEGIYKTAKRFIPQLQATFESLVKFHNNMIKEKISYIADELPILDSKLSSLYSDLSKETATEKELSLRLKKAGLIEELEEIIQQLNAKYEQKGALEEQLNQWNKTNENLKRIEDELKQINEGITSLDTLLDKRITEFNKFFSKLSKRLYDEQFILSYQKNDRAYELRISSIGGNLGTGKKKGQIAAFDFAYIQFCEENDIPCLHFILHDQIEHIHDNQLTILSDVSNEVNCQFIAPVLRDKWPPELNIDLYKILSLSQDEKLFKV